MARTMQNEKAAKKKAKANKKSIRKYMKNKKSEYKEQGMTDDEWHEIIHLVFKKLS